MKTRSQSRESLLFITISYMSSHQTLRLYGRQAEGSARTTEADLKLASGSWLAPVESGSVLWWVWNTTDGFFSTFILSREQTRVEFIMQDYQNFFTWCLFAFLVNRRTRAWFHTREKHLRHQLPFAFYSHCSGKKDLICYFLSLSLFPSLSCLSAVTVHPFKVDL